MNITSPPDSAYGLWFYPYINRFCDEDGQILHDLQCLFDIWQLELWKKTKDYGIMIDRNGDLCELYYLDPCEHECDICNSKCEIYEELRNWEKEHLEY